MIANDAIVCGTMLSMDTLFSDWLLEEIRKSGMNQAELARRSDISRGAISHLVNGSRSPGVNICISLAKGLKLPPEVVLRTAGILPSLRDHHSGFEDIIRYKLSGLSEKQLKEVINYLEFIEARDAKEKHMVIDADIREDAAGSPVLFKIEKD